MQYQTSFTRGQPDDDAIKEIRFYEGLALELDPRGYCVCTSEGKDSRVLPAIGHFQTAQELFDWWISDKAQDAVDEDQMELLGWNTGMLSIKKYLTLY